MDSWLEFWAAVMIISGGLFAGAAFALSWGLASIWRKLPAGQFKLQFAQNLKRADRIQPLLLLIAIVSSIGYALSCHGLGVTLSSLAASGFILTLFFSAAFMIPLQRRIIGGKGPLEAQRKQWLNGHHLRTFLAVVSFGLATAAVALHLH